NPKNYSLMFLAGSRAFRCSCLVPGSSGCANQRAFSGSRWLPAVTARHIGKLPLQSLPALRSTPPGVGLFHVRHF
ncbi:MAG: hypothetical protein ACOC1J_00055, partial [Prolixibacteraceae bacterium]